MNDTLKTIFEVLVAGFAVFGFYFSMMLLFQKLTSKGRVIIAVEILTGEAADNSDLLVREAVSRFFTLRRDSVAIIVTSELLLNPNLKKTVERYGLDCYVID